MGDGDVSKPEDIPQDVMDAAQAVVRGLWDRDRDSGENAEAIARAIMAERERCAKLVDQKCEFVLSRQNGKDEAVDLNLRLVAVTLPDLSEAIRKGTP